MRVHTSVLTVCVSLAATFVAASGAGAAADGTSVAPITLTAAQHVGAEAIDVSGNAPALRPLLITLVSTFSRDLPDVVLSRTVIVPDAHGIFSATLPIAPSFFRGSVITVFASSPNGGPAAHATYQRDWVNNLVPSDEMPRSIR